MDDILDRVKRIVADELEVDVSEISDDSSISELGGDSLKALSIISALEAEFDITIPDEEISHINSIKTTVEAVERHLRG
ncbi:MAG: phosphopantetheine-binding protein [Thermodesulfovibrionales bacterium]|nr:phosphopantetheine-binding protein [Thermodesulfovibrionales bacterium]